VFEKKIKFIAKANLVHGNTYDYSKVEYINYTTKVSIICPLHGIFVQAPDKHIYGKTGCPKCAGKYQTLESFIEKASKIHNNMYDYALVDYKNAHTKVIIICPIHGKFQQTPANHTLGENNCPACSEEKRIQQRTLDVETFVERSNIIHNNKYDYKLVDYKNSTTGVIIICPIHGNFSQLPDTHTHGKAGCPKCAGKNQTTEDFIEKANIIHNNKYDYAKSIYIDACTKLTITCDKHGDFQQSPNNHIAHQTGCKRCSFDNKKQTTEDFIEKANIIHNNKYDYSLVDYITTSTKVKIICQSHGIFLQSPTHHVSSKHGCPMCPQRHSKNSITWLNALATVHGIHIQHGENGGEYSIPNTLYHADGYCAETKTIYEFHGDYWHGNPQIYKPEVWNKVMEKTMGQRYQETIIRENEIKALGYNLVVMWEYDYNKSQKLLKRSARINTKHN
jgi:hypothetical protein